MGTVSLATLRARARERADFTSSNFVTDEANSLDALINEGAQRLHALLVEKFGQFYIVKSEDFTTVSGQIQYPLPSDFFKLLGVDLQLNGLTVDLEPFMFKERNQYKTATPRGYFAVLPRYSIVGGNIWFHPVPNAGYAASLWYAPQLQVASEGVKATGVVYSFHDLPSTLAAWDTVDAGGESFVTTEPVTSLPLVAYETISSAVAGEVVYSGAHPYARVFVCTGSGTVDYLTAPVPSSASGAGVATWARLLDYGVVNPASYPYYARLPVESAAPATTAVLEGATCYTTYGQLGTEVAYAHSFVSGYAAGVINTLVESTDTVTFDNGWEAYIVLYAAKAMLDKEESESAAITRELERLEAKIEQEAEFRDAAVPRFVVDTDAAMIDPRRIK